MKKASFAALLQRARYHDPAQLMFHPVNVGRDKYSDRKYDWSNSTALLEFVPQQLSQQVMKKVLVLFF